MIRAARAHDLPALRAVEVAAGAAFRDLGMTSIADDEPLPLEELAVYQRDGRAWVAVDGSDRPVAYLLVSLVDRNAHVEQVSVDPDHARRGLGRALLDVAEDWTRRQGLRALTLTTFADVPWNMPYYERLGFRVLASDEIGSGLREVQEHEHALGLTVWPRVSMQRDIPA